MTCREGRGHLDKMVYYTHIIMLTQRNLEATVRLLETLNFSFFCKNWVQSLALYLHQEIGTAHEHGEKMEDQDSVGDRHQMIPILSQDQA